MRRTTCGQVVMQTTVPTVCQIPIFSGFEPEATKPMASGIYLEKSAQERENRKAELKNKNEK
jgi:hypothetical protein